MKKIIIIAIFSVILFQSNQVDAIIFVEVTDAGELLDTAQDIGVGINEIHGNISPLGDIDLFILDFNVYQTVHFSTVKPGTWFDEDFFIFNSNGNPLFVPDPPNFDFDVMPGRYYLGLADWNTVATDADGNYIADDYYNVLKTDAVLGGWKVTSFPLRGGSYEISFSAETARIPEPSSMLLFGFSLLGAGLFKRRLLK